MNLILVIAAVLIGAGAYLIAKGLRVQDQTSSAHTRLLMFAVARGKQPEIETITVTGDGLFSWLEPSGKDRVELVARLQEAGFASARALQNFALIRLAISIGASFAVFMWASFSARLMVLPTLSMIMVAFVLLYFGAGYWLNYTANTRKMKVKHEFSFVIDMFVLTIEAGLSLDQAIRHVSRHSGRAAPLIQSGLLQLVHEIDTGVTYDVALNRWSRRLGVEEAHEIAAMFRQSLVHGAPLGESLRNYSSDLAERRMTEARESAGKIAVRMTLVMVLCFLPALMIMIGGPAMHSILNGLSGVPETSAPFPE